MSAPNLPDSDRRSRSAPDLDDALRRFGHPAFREGQRAAIETLLDEGRLLLVAPTGGGKSLTYQLPASFLPGTTIVVSPLISLMQDQVAHLEASGVPATYLASTVSAAETRARLERLASGTMKLVFVAPERLVFEGFRRLVATLDVPLVAIDEAHCISEWGHDFRPEYMEIGRFLADVEAPRVLACTATATPVVRDEILARLGLPADTPQMVHGFARPNLALRALEVSSRRERDRVVDGVLAEALGTPGTDGGGAIVYTPTRKSAEEEAARLGDQGWKVLPYHAGLPGEDRERTQSRFLEGDLEIVTATNAFGMGIDRADVRAVVHLAPPGSVEAYYQEVGRAGRDGKEAIGLLLVSPRDLPLRRHLLEKGADGEPVDPEVVRHKWGMFLELLRWAEGGSCRHDAILRYFGDEAETLAGCGRCDVCKSWAEAGEDDPDEAALVVRKALSGVARVHGRLGFEAAAKLLRGEDDERLSRWGLDGVRTFGVLSDEPVDWIRRVLRRCITAGWVDFQGGDRPVVVLTDAGREVMKGERPARLVLPPRKTSARTPSSPRPTPRPAAPPPSVDELDDVARGVFEALRRYRLERARADGVPPFVVASDRTLRDIAVLRPRSMDGLLAAHGIGATKLERYGDEILEQIRTATGGEESPVVGPADSS